MEMGWLGRRSIEREKGVGGVDGMVGGGPSV